MVTLSKTHPTIPGRRNGYRERWALVDGVVYHVSADHLNDLWTVCTDDEVIADPRERLAFVESDEYDVEMVFTLAEAREKIAAMAARRAARVGA